MEITQIEQSVKKIIYEQLGIPIEEAGGNDAHVVHDLGADSLDVIELSMCFEDDFGIHIDDNETAQLTTVQSCIDLVDRLVNKK